MKTWAGFMVLMGMVIGIYDRSFMPDFIDWLKQWRDTSHPVQRCLCGCVC